MIRIHKLPTQEYWEMQSTEPSPGSSSTTQALPISTSRLPSSLPAQVLITKGHGLTFFNF